MWVKEVSNLVNFISFKFNSTNFFTILITKKLFWFVESIEKLHNKRIKKLLKKN